MKIYQNCFRKETDADQCYQNSHFYEILKTQVYLVLKIIYSREKLLVSHRAPPQVADRGTLTRYGRYRVNKIPGVDHN